MDNILIIEDHQSTRQGLTSLLKKSGYQVDEACNGCEAEAMITGTSYDLILVDLLLPYINGLELLKKVKEMSPDTEVIVITGHESIESAINSMKLGAYDYLLKPFEPQKIIESVHHAIERKNFLKHSTYEPITSPPALVGRSKKMIDIFKLLGKISDIELPILIIGEDGTGKKTLAQTIHQNSPWRTSPFIMLNCLMIPDDLSKEQSPQYLETQILEKTQSKAELKCTLYLKNIDKATPSVQSSLLFFLDTANQFTGKVRLISSSKKNLQPLIEKNLFSQDLFSRLLSIYLHPLREKKIDIPLLANHFLSKYAISPSKSISPKVLSLFLKYHWPGNIQEIKNVIEYAVLMSTQNQIIPEDLPSYIREIESPLNDRALISSDQDLTLKGLEKIYILKKLETNYWDKQKTAKDLGIGRTTLWRKLKQYGITDHTSKKAN